MTRDFFIGWIFLRKTTKKKGMAIRNDFGVRRAQGKYLEQMSRLNLEKMD
jgi:hypothetical protein